LFQYFLDGTVHHNEVMCCVAIPWWPPLLCPW
jgi:hypothetical protein